MSKILNCRFKRPGAGYRLLCFPWAGGGSSFYAGWGKLMSENIEVVGITLAGRESRFTDQCCDDLEETMREITQVIKDQLQDKPLVFWGHSMGALMAFETALRLKKITGREPVKMFLSGVSAPHSPMRKRYNVNSTMTEAEFLLFLKKLGGTPTELLDNEEMMKLVIPCLRADYSLIDSITYARPDGAPEFSCPISFFDGDEDVKHDIDAWKTLTSGHFSLTMLPGGHFYLREKANMLAIIEKINRDFAEEHEVV